MKIDKAMMDTADIWSKMSYCKRMQVGAVLAKDKRILVTGYNGTVHGAENICECYEVYEDEVEGDSITCPDCKGSGESHIKGTPYSEDCKKCNGFGKLKYIDKTNEFTVHAEQNVITFAAKNGISTKDTTLYITLSPCKTCAKLIVQAGISRVVYKNDYRDNEGIEFLKKCKVKCQKL